MMMRTNTLSAFSVLVAATLAGRPVAQATAGDNGVPALVHTALEAATTVPNARVDVVALERSPSTCSFRSDVRVEIPRPVDGSGKFAVKLIGARASGETCEGWIWAQVRVFAKVSVATRVIRAGDSFAGATEHADRELKAGRVPAASLEGATADRSLGLGQMIEEDFVRAPGLRPGEMVKILVVSGSLSVEQMGRAVPCARNRSCAVLPSGRHVDGTMIDGRLLVELP
jgi:flagella basal body P-ring formation protein FlgA